MTLPIEYLNTTCQIHATNNMIIGVGKVTKIEHNFIIINNDVEGFPTFQFLSYVKLTLRHPTAGYMVLLANVSESNPNMLRLANLTLLTNSEKRGYFRVYVGIQTRVFLSDNANTVERQYAPSITNKAEQEAIPLVDEPVQVLKVVIRNMSLSGLLFESNTFLQVGKRVIVEIQTKKKPEYYLVMIRRRTREIDMDNEPYQYGCVLQEKGNRKMDNLCQIILENQAHIIQKVKNN